MLTGRRLPLLRDTLSSLRRTVGDLGLAHVIVYLNGKDDETDAYVRSLPYVTHYLYRATPNPEPIGNAVSRLVELVPSMSRYHMHLEDDWRCVAENGTFILDAMTLLERRSDVGQIRMRLASEKVLKHHLITKAGAPWKDETYAGIKYRTAKLHFTFNPSLVRVADLPKIYPANHENVAMERYMKHFTKIAQLVPGAFRHTGDDASLRAKMGRA